MPVATKEVRATVAAVLGERAALPRFEEVEEAVLFLRGHMMLLIPEIEDLSRLRPKDDLVVILALAGVGEARRKLRMSPGPGLVSAVEHAKHLARSCDALLRHYELLVEEA
ncbi:DUF6415 family natural product biosynthesis protein [Streptomyces sp. LX-29]|uniref:DUF6415 family natural product biosynthesis protein n=1 Tax=Streptomyces sp. LX-29 TaxID=2900152 RepID=UPI00240E53BF|nr:DUF6415 family natural product biosynthesis protein [Streptomyces sp. LX-29]WFB08959.1 DUF6415 family natural product biosynthesis protein [Streptomyces sp. LX-29]